MRYLLPYPNALFFLAKARRAQRTTQIFQFLCDLCALVRKNTEPWNQVYIALREKFEPEPRTLNLRCFEAFVASLRKPLGSFFVRSTVVHFF